MTFCLFSHLFCFVSLSVSFLSYFFHVFISTFSLYYFSFVSILTFWCLVYYLFLVISVFSALLLFCASLHFVAHLLALLSLPFFISNFFLSSVVSLDTKIMSLASWDDIPRAVCRRLAQLMITFSCKHVRWMPVGWQRERFPLVVHRSVTNSSFRKALIHLVEKSGKRLIRSRQVRNKKDILVFSLSTMNRIAPVQKLLFLSRQKKGSCSRVTRSGVCAMKWCRSRYAWCCPLEAPKQNGSSSGWCSKTDTAFGPFGRW